VERMSQAFQWHVESSVPGNSSLLGRSHHPGELRNLGLRAFSHISGLVEFPDLAFGDLIVGARDDEVVHVNVGLIVADILIGELVWQDIEVRAKDVEATVSFSEHGEGEEHDPASSIK